MMEVLTIDDSGDKRLENSLNFSDESKDIVQDWDQSKDLGLNNGDHKVSDSRNDSHDRRVESGSDVGKGRDDLRSNRDGDI